MKRDRVLEETRRGLAKTGFFLSRPHGERGLCFDFVARRDDTLLIVKVLQNVDALSKDTAHELVEVARILEGSPLVVGERSGTGSLEDGVIYTRFGVSILSRRTLGEFLEEGIPPFLYSAPGGLYVRLDADALRRLREERQVSLGTLADIAGVTRRTIQMYLEGMSATMEVAMRLEEFLNESLVMPVDPFALLADPTAREERLPQIDGFEREMFERLERLGYRVLRTVRSPFDALSKHEETTFLTGVGEADRALERKAEVVSNLSRVAHAAPPLPRGRAGAGELRGGDLCGGALAGGTAAETAAVLHGGRPGRREARDPTRSDRHGRGHVHRELRGQRLHPGGHLPRAPGAKAREEAIRREDPAGIRARMGRRGERPAGLRAPPGEARGVHGRAPPSDRRRGSVRARGNRGGTDKGRPRGAARLASDILRLARVSQVDRIGVGSHAVDIDWIRPRRPVVLV